MGHRVSRGEEGPREKDKGSDERCHGRSLLCSLNLKEGPQDHLTQSPASKPLKAGGSVCQISRKGDSPASLIGIPLSPHSNPGKCLLVFGLHSYFCSLNSFLLPKA